MGFDTSRLNEKLGRLPKQFADKQAKIGWPAGKAYPDGTPVAYIAAIQNFGVPDKSIPPRPMLKPAVAEHQSRWTRIMQEFIRRVAQGDMDGFDAMENVGRVAAMDLQATIAKIDDPELSPITVLLRKWRKAGRTITGKTVGEAAAAIDAGESPGSDNKPLNDTGYLIASVAHGVGKDDGNFVDAIQ